MSIWDSVKPAPKRATPTAVALSKDGRELLLTWSDGGSTQLSARQLRQYCPCAQCVEEWTGKRTFDPESIPVDTTMGEVKRVGNYALSLTFGDLHSTGIYPWAYLRDLSAQSRAE